MHERVIARDVFVASPAHGVAVWASSCYTQREGRTLMSFHSHLSRSDTLDVAFIRLSEDNGRSWSDTTVQPTRCCTGFA